MKKDKVIVIGSGGHAKVVIDIIEAEGRFGIAGIVTNDQIRDFCGYKVFGNDEYLLAQKESGITNVAIGIGGFIDNLLRKKVYEKMIGNGFVVINAIHPSAIVSSSVVLGEGVVLFAGVILNPEVKILNNTIVATGSTVDHETVIENHCLISAGVTIGANVRIMENVVCALGSKVVSQVVVGKGILIGAGAVVVNNINEKGLYLGVPAKKKP